MAKRILLVLIALIVIGAVGFFALAWKPAIAPVDPPAAASFEAPLVARGEQLAGAGNCASCHTAPGGAAYAGGLAMETGFGTVYSTNITPDAETGIGRWSREAFVRAMREGVARDGSHLLPAFPYDHFTKVRDEDLDALYAYFMTRAAISAGAPANTIPFPLNIRLLQAGWKLLFFDLHKGVYEARADKSEAWNRGAYLAEGLGHCGACHTPRNSLGAEKRHLAYAGASIKGWWAPALNAASTSPMPWTQDDLYAYLRTGGSTLHGVAAGTMSDVVHVGLAKLPDEDVRAVALYFADLNGSAARTAASAEALTQAMARSRADASEEIDAGAALYRAACSSCHYNGGAQPLAPRPELALSSTVTGPDPSNFIHIVLHGIGDGEGLPGLYMPGFAASLSDADIANLAAYLRRSRSDQPAWNALPSTVAKLRTQPAGAEQ